MTPTRPPRPAGVLVAAGLFTRRYLLQLRRSPDLIAVSILQPILFVLLFAFILGGAITAPGVSYAQYFIPGVLVQTAAFIALGSTAAGLAEELRRGVIDRYRALPAGVVGLLLGRTAGDSARTCVTLAIVLGLGVAIGLRFHGAAVTLIGGLALLVLASWVFSWVGAVFALCTRSVEAPTYGALLVLFPLTFASSAYVPIDSMPALLQPLATHNPITALVDTLRAATGGTTATAAPLASLAWLAGLLTLAIPTALMRLNRWGRR